MKKEDLFMIIPFVLIGLLGILAFWGINGFSNTYLEMSCEIGKLNSADGLLEDIERMTEHRILCNDNNCTDEFDNKVNRKIEIIEKMMGLDCKEFIRGDYSFTRLNAQGDKNGNN